MKVTLEYNLPEENVKYRLALFGPDLHEIIWDTVQFLRRKVNKGEHDYKTADEALEAVWDFIHSTDWHKYEEL